MAAQASSSGHDEYDFDLFVLGGGTGGVRAARMSAQYGGRVALCELKREWVATDEAGGLGGTCILRGCVPKKLLHYASSFTEEIEDAGGYGWSLPQEAQLDWGKLMANQHKELERLSTLYQKGLEGAGVKYFEARGKVTGPHSVEVDGHSFKVKNILVAVGGKPIRVPIEGAEHCIVSDQILHLDKQPKKVAMIGGGYISCEQASIYNNFGAEVHLLVRSDRVLNPAFDLEARDFVGEQYQHAGIKLALNTTPTKIEKGSDGKLTVTCEPKEGEPYKLDGCDLVMMATGRAPATKELGLEEIGVKLDPKGGVVVDAYSRSVSVPSVWAVGDVTNRIPLTPVARMEGLLLAQHLFKNNMDARPDYQLVASVVFSSPEVAVIGLTEQAAVEQHKNVAVFSSSFTPMKASISARGVKALCKVVVDTKTDQVVGIHIVCPEASEILQGFAAAMKAGITKKQLDETVGLHPTSAEEFCTMYEPDRVYKDGSQHISTPI